VSGTLVAVSAVSASCSGSVSCSSLGGSRLVRTARVDEAAFPEAEPGQASADSPPVDHKTDAHKFVDDPLRGPLVLAAPGFDLLKLKMPIFGGDVGDGTCLAPLHEAPTALDAQGRIRVGHSSSRSQTTAGAALAVRACRIVHF
jgi:hypothetical protein